MDYKLKLQLDSVQELDSKLRMKANEIVNRLSEYNSAPNFDKDEQKIRIDSVLNLLDSQTKIDESNILFIDSVIAIYGYPGISVVGSPTNEVAWYVIQHSQKISHYLPLIKKAGRKNEIPKYLVAKMIDRKRMEKGKAQIYGTQGQSKRNEDGTVIIFIWPIKHPNHVNKRRLKVGFENTVEENAKQNLNCEYKVLKLKDVK